MSLLGCMDFSKLSAPLIVPCSTSPLPSLQNPLLLSALPARPAHCVPHVLCASLPVACPALLALCCLDHTVTMSSLAAFVTKRCRSFRSGHTGVAQGATWSHALSVRL